MKQLVIRTAAMVAVAATVLTPLPAGAEELPPGGTFWDDYLNVHEPDIEAIAAAGVTKGCNPPEGDKFCPDQPVTRAQMSAFVVRAFGLPPAALDYFVDDAGTTFEGDINRLAEAGIASGCNPPENDHFCPEDPVRRKHMAAFLARALDLPPTDIDHFVDDDGSIFEDDINRLAEARITLGCNPPENDLFCPDTIVERDQMGSFLARALGLDPIDVPPLDIIDPRWPKTISVLTDSVVLGADRYIPEGFPDYDYEMLGKPAMMLHQVEDTFLRPGKQVGSLVVVGLGYNSLWERDRHRYDKWAARFDEQADEVVRDLVAHGALKIAWVTLREPAPHAIQTPQQADQMYRWGWYLPYVNERIRLLPDRHPQVVVADWASASKDPGYTYDLIHLNPAGARLMSNVIAETFGFPHPYE